MTSNQNKEGAGKQLYVVGVGASAGGLDAISKFLSNFNGVTADFCVIIVMHLSPTYKSELTSILTKRCNWPVITVEEISDLEPRYIYVTPQNRDLHLEGNRIILDTLPSEYAFAPSIDNFFSSLAKVKGKYSVGIILSGFGKDGAAGMKEIKNNQGFTVVQLPETAEHRDMPEAAIKTESVDLVIPAEQMFDEIVQYIQNRHTIAESMPAKKSIDTIFELLEKRSGTDFSLYKPTTIIRRINQRIKTLQLESLQEYCAVITNSPKELDVLFETVLIGVTEFFRDAKAFEKLEKQLKALIAEKQPGDSIRIWCVGCATGEEPYSIGILIHELLGFEITRYHLQIFASDIDDRALNFARKGIYSEDSLKQMDPNIIRKYFTRKDQTHYELSKVIRQYVLFTRHDISTDPPFVKLDAVVCRNLLIYFNNELQKRALQIFHYALLPKGLLFLGKSESVSVVPSLYEKSGNYNFFYKAEASLDYGLRFSRYRDHTTRYIQREHTTKTNNMSVVETAKETLYYKFQHPFVIINDNAEIKEVHGSLRLYLEISQGTMNANLYKMVNAELATVVKSLHSQVRKTGVQHTSHTVKFHLYESDHFVKINITPLIYTIQDVHYYMVIFEKVELSEHALELQKKLETTDFVDFRIKELEDELAKNKEYLQIFTEEIEATNEELQTINEELQSANEELKSINEELETSNEELQSANEELNTANYELRITNKAYLEKEKELKEEKELSERNESIYRTIAENIPDGTVGILNENFEIEYVAGKGLEGFKNLTAQGLIGRSMPHVNPSKRERDKLIRMCQKAFDGKPSSTQVEYEDRYFFVKALPFHLPHVTENKILYLAQDISPVKNNQLLLDTALEASKLIVFRYDYETDEIEPNDALSNFLEVPSGKELSENNIRKLVHPEDKALHTKSMNKSLKTGVVNHEIRLQLESGIRHIRITGRIRLDENGQPKKMFATILDITEDKILLERVKESEKRFRRIADAVPMTIWKSDEAMNCVYVNKFWLNYTGSSLEENIRNGFIQFIHPDDRKDSISIFTKAHKDHHSFTQEYRARAKDGTYRWFVNRGVPIIDADGNFSGCIGTNVDITDTKKFTESLENKVAQRTEELKNANDELIKVNMNLEEYAYVASHDLQEPLRKIRMFNSILREQKEDKEQLEKYSTRIENLAERMMDLIKGILIYGELSKSDSEQSEVNLDKLVEEIKDDFEDFLSDNDAQLITEKELGGVKGSYTYMYQLFVNLIRNGIKFNKNKAVIRIRTSTIQGEKLPQCPEANTSTLYRTIEITDNGIGIDEKYHKIIFKPFKRLHSKSDFPGTGIGLAICKRIVSMHNGFLEIVSAPEKGTTFKIYLPAA